MLPRPTAEPAAASTKSQRLDQRCDAVEEDADEALEGVAIGNPLQEISRIVLPKLPGMTS